MGRKIFVTYKYSDSKVQNITSGFRSTARDYVDFLQNLINEEDHINKGEEDNESLDNFKDDTIESKLKDKIFDSSITIIVISKGMKDVYKSETDQWIPWEISYSLKELTREGKTSKSNALLGIVLPDENGNYEYFLTYDANCNCTNYNTSFLFRILRQNMFNIKQPVTTQCNGKYIYHNYFSYIYCVKWDEFKLDLNKYVDIALKIKENISEYNIAKTVE